MLLYSSDMAALYPNSLFKNILWLDPHRIKHRAIASLIGRFHGNGRAKEWAWFFSGVNRPFAHTVHTQDMSMRKIGQRTKPEHMAALNTVRKAICIRCVKLSDHKNEFCHFSYSKTLYQMHTLFFSRPIYSTRWPANGSVQSVSD